MKKSTWLLCVCIALAGQIPLAGQIALADDTPTPPTPPAPGAPAPSAPSRQTMQGVRTACQADMEKLCPGVQPGGGRILACLKEHKEEVSEGCKQAILKARQSSG